MANEYILARSYSGRDILPQDTALSGTTYRSRNFIVSKGESLYVEIPLSHMPKSDIIRFGFSAKAFSHGLILTSIDYEKDLFRATVINGTKADETANLVSELSQDDTRYPKSSRKAIYVRGSTYSYGEDIQLSPAVTEFTDNKDQVTAFTTKAPNGVDSTYLTMHRIEGPVAFNITNGSDGLIVGQAYNPLRPRR